MPRQKILLEQRKSRSKSEHNKGRREILQGFSSRLWLADVAILIPLWLIFAGKLSWSELAIALVSASLAASVTEVIRSIGFARFYPRLHWLIYVGRVPADVLVDCSILIAVLARRILDKRQERSFFETVPFHSGGADARSAARRAMAITVGTLSPNTYVVDIEPHNDFALLHQLRAARSPSFLHKVGNE